MIVTNDDMEYPIKEVTGGDDVAKFLGIHRKLFYKYMVIGFPKKYKYKAIVVKEMQYLTEEEKKARQRYTSKKYSMTHDRSEYFRRYWRKKRYGELIEKAI